MSISYFGYGVRLRIIHSHRFVAGKGRKLRTSIKDVKLIRKIL